VASAPVFKHSPAIASPDQAREVRARAWVFVFECWHTRKGDHDDLTKRSNQEYKTSQDKKGKEHADVHGD
jgi:hypothetical protein